MEKLKPKVGILLRNVTRAECYWLESDLLKGTAVFLYRGPTWSCITPEGIAVTLDPTDDYPFIELPVSAIRWDA